MAHTRNSISVERNLGTLEGANLAGVDFTGADLAGMNFTGTNFSGANLTGANLSCSHFTHAILVGAILVDADLQGSYLEGTNLEGANLEGANLCSTNLSGADLTNANLKGANLSTARLSETDFTGAKLEGTILDPRNTDCAEVLELEELELEVDGDYVYGWRTQYSEHVGNNCYATGTVHVAPVFSVCNDTACHPGIYFSTNEYLDDNAYSLNRVRCRSLVKDCLVVNGKVRTRRLEIL